MHGVLRHAKRGTDDSGTALITNAAMLLLGGGEAYELIFNIPAFTNSTYRLGSMDSASSTDAADGAYIEIASTGVATGKTASNNSRTSTGTTYTVATGASYRARITVNSGATAVTFTVYDDSGTALWTDSVTATIPTATDRETGAGIVATNSGTVATDLIYLDYMAVTWATDRTR